MKPLKTFRLSLQMFGGRGGIGGSGALTIVPDNPDENGKGSLRAPGKVQYGLQDPGVNGKVRTTVEEFERTYKIEKDDKALGLDKDGNVVSRPTPDRRDKSVAWKSSDLDGVSVITFNHYAADGYLGGTFTKKELSTFMQKDTLATMRRATKEGTYSISKGENFDAKGFASYIDTVRTRAAKAQSTALARGATAAEADNIARLVIHDGYIAHQSTYGYTYTLERTHGKRHYNKGK